MSDEEKITEEFEKQINEEKKIVEALNSLNEKVLKNYYPKLEIQQQNKFIIYQFLEIYLNSIETSENEKEDNFESKMAIAVFKTLFIGKSGFNKKDLDKKLSSFNLILKLLCADKLNCNDNNAIKEMQKYQLFDEIAKEYDCDNYYSYCLYLILEYSETKLFFIDSFISFMKNSFKEEGKNLEIVKNQNITEDNLKKISSINLAKSLKDIYNKGDSFIALEIDQEKNLIRQRQISPEEMAEIIDNKKEAKKKKKRSKKKKKTKENNNIIENNPEESKEQEERKNQDETDRKAESESHKENEEENKIHHEIDNSQIASIRIDSQINKEDIKIDKDFGTITNYSDDNGEKNKETNQIYVAELRGKINEMDKKIGKLTKLIGQVEEMKNEINVLKKWKKKTKKTVKNLKTKNIKLEGDLLEIQNELILIQLRDVIKNIIDLFCKAYNISLDLCYIDKYVEIKKIIKLKVRKEEQFELCNFFEKIYTNWFLSNKNAHSIDLSKPIIQQLFARIDQNGEFRNVQDRLSRGKLNDLLYKLGVNRNENFNDKAKLRKEEEKIFDDVNNIGDIYPKI